MVDGVLAADETDGAWQQARGIEEPLGDELRHGPGDPHDEPQGRAGRSPLHRAQHFRPREKISSA
jgi:hypothetical protein